MEVDPVCGLELDETDDELASTYEDKTYHFCSGDCKEEFDAAPEDYVGGEGK